MTKIPNDDRDYAIMANIVYIQLCLLDKGDRNSERDSQWHDITKLAETAGAFDNRVDVAYLAETILQDERDS